MKTFRLLALADTHCGHRSGLTPPAYQFSAHAHNPARRKYAKIQQLMWDWYCSTLDSLRPFDAAIFLGDAIEGKGERSGGCELITTDRKLQVEIAAECVKIAKAKQVHLIYGTSAHAGVDEDWEDVLAGELGANIGSHDWFSKYGVVIDCRHFVSSSVIPHGRHTSISRERLWNVLWSERGAAPRANIILRAHVHYHVIAGGSGWVAMTLPCLQAWTKFGSRRCSGDVDIGLTTIEITEGGEWGWKVHPFDLRLIATKAVEL